MADLFSLTDFFAVGIGLDITGAYLLASGLLMSTAKIRGVSGTYFDLNPREIVARVDDRVSATFGLGALVLGFVMQAVGYVVSLGIGSEAQHSWGRAGVAAALSVLAGLGALLVHRAQGQRLRRHLLVEMARLTSTGGRSEVPYGAPLLNFGSPDHPAMPDESQADYALRVWRVDEVIEGWPQG